MSTILMLSVLVATWAEPVRGMKWLRLVCHLLPVISPQMRQTYTLLECPGTVQHWRGLMNQTSQPSQQQPAATAACTAVQAAPQAAAARSRTWPRGREGLLMPLLGT